ncbi:hypothetical protein D5086_033335 [Populus alba]|uniref:Uncharacterized protein n=1 Tax=Populus alba TaxID=43335 RepID=A0ACC4AGJ7_POPAL
MADLALTVPDAALALSEHALTIGQEFPNVETCRRTLKDIAIALHFDLRIVKSDRSRFIAKCSKEGCPWRVHVAKCPGVPTFSIRTLHGEHTCEGVQNLHHQQASVVYALTAVEFESKIAEMVDISQDIIPWFEHFSPRLWAVAYFEGMRYGHFMLGVTELLYNWALECHELPIVQMMEHIRYQLTSWFSNRRDIGMSWTSILVPSAEKRILEAIADAHCYQVLRANEVEFEIVSTERTNIVDIRSRVCSCRRWQLYGLPCAHAAAALISCGQNAHLFAEPCFTVASYRETYSEMINPIPDKSLWRELGEGTEGGGAKVDITIRPPKTRRPPGRPKKKVLRVENFKRPKRVVQCGRCHLLGHSQKKCTKPI